MRRPALAVLVACFVVLTAAPRAAETWTYAASEHFDLYTTSNARRAREILVYFERVHTFFADYLKIEPTPRKPTRLVVFSNDREYQHYRISDVSSAYYAPGPDRDYIVMRSFDSASYPTVVHEYAHLAARHANARYPPWLNEGLAEFFSTLSPLGGEMSIGRVPRARLRELHEGGPRMDLARLLDVRNDSPEYTSRTHSGMFYAQSWALTHMVVMGEQYRSRSARFIEAAATGTPSAEAFAAVYGKSIQDVSDDLRSYLADDVYLYISAKYRDPRIPAEFPTRPVALFEATLVLTNLLADRLGRTDEARKAYEALAAERPDDVDLLDARALFEYRRGADREASRPHLAKAVAANSQNPDVYRSLGFLTASPPERAALLKTAIALDPNDVAIRLAYASASLAAGDFGTTRETLDGVKNLPLDRAFSFFEVVANLALRMDHFHEARLAALQARKYAAPGAEEAFADRLIQVIDSNVANRAVIAARRAENEAARAWPDADQVSPASLGSATGVVDSATRIGDGPVVSRLTKQVLTVAAGSIRHTICTATPPVIEILTNAGTLRLAIDDPLKITVEGTGGTTTDITCGAQNRRVRVGYVPDVSAGRRTAGVVRLLDFR